VVVLHSAAGDRMSILNHTAGWFQGRRGALAVFIGNEYDLMSEKISFLQKSGADFVCTQLPVETARQLYDGSGAEVVPMPHALNPRVYRVQPGQARTIDVAFVGDLYDRLIGDRERTAIVEFFSERAAEYGLRSDIRRQRMPRDEWTRYLNTCHGVIGAESGTYYLQKTGAALRCAKRYVTSHPSATFDDVHRRCFAGAQQTLNGKAISSRHFEPIGTGTCQLLVEGHYNGILEADKHYIAVKRDLSNITDAIARFTDESYRAGILATAYDHVVTRHTYDHRIATLVHAMSRARGEVMAMS
jgi:spore maturation protein CgeB